MNVFEITRASAPIQPIIVSCPHVGTDIPGDIRSSMHQDVATKTEDTDWFIHELYRFAPSLGITMIKANMSRYVVDLNRDPSGKSLYSDQRRQTALVPETTFAGQNIYQTGPLTEQQIEARKKLDVEPYHQKIEDLLAELNKDFKQVLLFDAHSIKRLVTSIRPDPFPDMIVGDNDGKTCDKSIASAALGSLRGGGYKVQHNDPFKGGFITRNNGRITQGRHAIQLEMSQDLYMNEADNSRNEEKRDRTASALVSMFKALIDVMKEMNR